MSDFDKAVTEAADARTRMSSVMNDIFCQMNQAFIEDAEFGAKLERERMEKEIVKPLVEVLEYAVKQQKNMPEFRLNPIEVNRIAIKANEALKQHRKQSGE